MRTTKTKSNVEIRLLDLSTKCVQASYKDQSSFNTSLSNLIKALKENQQHQQQQNEVETSDEILLIQDVLQKVASNLLSIEMVHMIEDNYNYDSYDDDINNPFEKNAISTQERQIHQKMNQVLFDYCGLRICFQLAIEILYSDTSSSTGIGISSTSKNTSTGTIVRILSATKLIRRILLQCQYEDDVCVSSSSSDDYIPNFTLLQRFLHEYFVTKTQQKQLGRPNDDLCHSTKILEKQMMDLIHTTLIVLPTQIANVYHSISSGSDTGLAMNRKYKLPLWATRMNFFTKLIESSLNATMIAISTNNEKCQEDGAQRNHNDDAMIEFMYSVKLIEILLRHGHSDCIAKGIYQFWKKKQYQTESSSSSKQPQLQQRCIKMMQDTIYKIMIKISSSSSSKNNASLVRSCMKLIISEIEIYPTIMTRSNIQSTCDEYCLPFLMDVCNGLLDDEDNREMIVNVLILSPSRSNNDDVELKMITRCVVELLIRHDHHYYHHSNTVKNDKNEKSNHGASLTRSKSNLLLLLHELKNVVLIWNDIHFINETDYFQQRHLTSFLLDALDYLEKDESIVTSSCTDQEELQQHQKQEQQNVIQEMVMGVTNRLNITKHSIRVDGMLVAEKLAPMLGESLQFDELDGLRDEDLVVDAPKSGRVSNNDDGVKDATSNLKLNKTKQRRDRKKTKKKPKAIIDIDPDEEYDSDASHESEIISSESSTSESYVSSDSEWGEENLNEFALSDDEEDLCPVPKPKFLQECLVLLRSTDDDEDVKYKHEIALQEINSLVRDSPPDLSDMAPLLADALVEIENKYNNEMFDQNRLDGLCALTTCSPMTTVPILQRKIFEESPLNLRLDILNVLKHASLELCGQLDMEKHRTLKSIPKTNTDISKVANELKTRRWGSKSRVSKPKVFRNKFANLSPLFFYPLIQGFAESKHNETIWGGENGGRLLSSLLITLSTFVENAANHPGTSTIAADLFDISWSFSQAENPEVRLSVLVCLATCYPHLTPEYMMRMVCIEHLPMHLHQIQQHDPSGDCRSIAAIILGAIQNVTDLTIG